MAGSSSESSPEIERVVLSARRRIKWQELEISDEVLNRDWRVRSKFEQKSGEYWEYYCAYGKSCPAIVKKKMLLNGVIIFSTNGVGQDNHRSFDFGLSEEQKNLVLECLASGVTTPKNILITFRVKKVKEPKKLQISNYLLHNRKKVLQ